MSKRRLTINDIQRISETIPNIWDLAAQHFEVTPEHLKEMIEAGSIYFEPPLDAAKALSDFMIEQWNKETDSDYNRGN